MNGLEDLSFMAPELLKGLILIVPGLAGVYLLCDIISRRLKTLGHAENPTLKTRGLIVLSLLVIMLVALARPYLGSKEVSVDRPGSDILVVLDVSKSMLAKDVGDTRLNFAKRKISDLIDLIVRERRGDRVGIVLFAGESYLFTPLTADYNVLRVFLRAINTDLISSEGSALKSALATATRSLKEVKAENGRILLVTDGEASDVAGSEGELKAEASYLKLHILGVGSPEGSPIELARGHLLRDSRGELVISRLNEELLKGLAAASGAVYHRARLGEEDLRELLGLHAPGSQQSRETLRIYNEFGAQMLWIPLFVISLAYFVGRKESVLLALISCLIFSANPAYAQYTGSLHEGYLAYEAGDFKRAAEIFNTHLQRHPDDTKTVQALASALYKAEQYKESAQLFNRLLQRGTTGREKFNGSYNLGNAKFMQQDFEGAIDAYEKALIFKPDDEKTKHNLKVAKKLLQAKQEQEQSQEKNNKEKDGQNRPQQNQDPHNQDSQDQSNKPPDQSKDQKKSEDSDSSERPKKQEQESETQSRDERSDSGDQDKDELSSAEPTDKNPSEKAELPEYDPKALKEREAAAWLESFDDSPILLQRKTKRTRSPNGQTW